MKRICIILSVAISSYFILSCKEKTRAEKFKEKMENAGDNIKDKTDDAAEEVEKQSKKAKDKIEDMDK